MIIISDPGDEQEPIYNKSWYYEAEKEALKQFKKDVKNFWEFIFEVTRRPALEELNKIG